MKARSFSHVGITVSDFNRAVHFYWDVFRCPLVGVADTPPERVRAFFSVHTPSPEASPLDNARGALSESRRAAGQAGDAPRCKIGWIRIPGGGVIEIFEFQPQLPPSVVPWNRVGLTHFSLNVRNTHRWYKYLRRKGVECINQPERSPRGHWFFFARDMDGNLIEMMDLGYMHYVLRWLGPLGGFIFRRGMYRKYYE